MLCSTVLYNDELWSSSALLCLSCSAWKLPFFPPNGSGPPGVGLRTNSCYVLLSGTSPTSPTRLTPLLVYPAHLAFVPLASPVMQSPQHSIQNGVSSVGLHTLSYLQTVLPTVLQSPWPVTLHIHLLWMSPQSLASVAPHLQTLLAHMHPCLAFHYLHLSHSRI